jgi:hypothetical protein
MKRTGLTPCCLNSKEERKTYMIAPNMRDVLMDEVKAYRLYLTSTRQGVITFIPVPLPDIDGRANQWHESLMRVCDLATREWVRMVADMGLGGYQTYTASGDIPEPEWPDKPMNELLRIAFQGRYIDSEDHAVVRQLYGRA